MSSIRFSYGAASRRFMMRTCNGGMDMCEPGIPPLPPEVAMSSYDPLVLLDHQILDMCERYERVHSVHVQPVRISNPSDCECIHQSRNMDALSMSPSCRLHGSPKSSSATVSPVHNHHYHPHHGYQLQSRTVAAHRHAYGRGHHHHQHRHQSSASPPPPPPPPPPIAAITTAVGGSSTIINIDQQQQQQQHHHHMHHHPLSLPPPMTPSRVAGQRPPKPPRGLSSSSSMAAASMTSLSATAVATSSSLMEPTAPPETNADSVADGAFRPSCCGGIYGTGMPSDSGGGGGNCAQRSSLRRRWHGCPELHKAMEGVTYIADHTKKEEESTKVSSRVCLIKRKIPFSDRVMIRKRATFTL